MIYSICKNLGLQPELNGYVGTAKGLGSSGQTQQQQDQDKGQGGSGTDEK